MEEIISNEIELSLAEKYLKKAHSLSETDNFNAHFFSILQKAIDCFTHYQYWEQVLLCQEELIAAYLFKGQTAKALEWAEKGRELSQKEKSSLSPARMGHVYYQLFICHFRLFQFEKAKVYVDTLLEITQQMDNSELRAKAYAAKAGLLVYDDKYNEALYCFFQTLSINQKNNSHTTLQGIYVLINIAHTLAHTPQSYLSQLYYKRSLELLEEYHSKDLAVVAVIQQTLGTLAFHAAQLEVAFDCFREAIRIKNLHGQKDIILAGCLAYMGYIHIKRGSWEIAEQKIEEALDIQQKQNSDDFDWFCKTYVEISSTYIGKQQFKRAMIWLERGMQHIPIEAHSYRAFLTLQKARVFEGVRKIKQAWNNIQLAHRLLHKSLEEGDKELHENQFYILFHYLQIGQKRYTEEKSFVFFPELTNIVSEFQAFVQNYRNQIFSEKDYLKYNEEVAKGFQLAMELLYAYLQEYKDKDVVEKLFELMEQNKVHQLLSKLQESTALQSGLIPKIKIKEIQQLKEQINRLRKQIQFTSKDDSDRQDSFASELIDCQLQLHQLTQELEEQYPDYTQKKTAYDVAPISNLQATLKVQTAIVSYTFTDKYLFVYWIGKHMVEVMIQDRYEQLSEGIKTMVFRGIIGLNRKLYAKHAHELYLSLFEPIAHLVASENIQNLIVLPDAVLHQVPFEALLTQETDYRTSFVEMPYLLKKCTIQYHYSATLWFRFQSRKKQELQEFTKQKNSFIGLAPVYDAHQDAQAGAASPYPIEATRALTIDGQDYEALLYSEIEISEAAQLVQKSPQKSLTQALVLAREKATYTNLKNSLEKQPYRFVHIAAHSSLTKDEKELTGILLSPEKQESSSVIHSLSTESSTANPFAKRTGREMSSIMSPDDVSLLNLQADLVFLSTCKSGVGKMSNGEGVLSLNRSFLYAGVPNILFTIFKIYDRKTPLLTQHFYKAVLQQNKSYAEALRYAKLQMIASNIPPKFWSGFLLLGN